MKHFAGLDVSFENTSVCVLDADGQIVSGISVVSHADDIFSALSPYLATLDAIGLEAGPLSEFLVCGLQTKGVHAILMETRRVHAALSAIPVKTDRKDACGIANLIRMGWYQPVHLKTPAARDLRLLLSARETLGRRMRDLDKQHPGIAARILRTAVQNSSTVAAGCSALCGGHKIGHHAKKYIEGTVIWPIRATEQAIWSLRQTFLRPLTSYAVTLSPPSTNMSRWA